MRAILTYHSIDSSSSPISVDAEAFDRHVRWLSSGRVLVTTVERLVALPEAEDAVAITFDDGFTNFSEVAAPRLLAHGLPVTLFVVSGRAGATNTWNGQVDRSVPELPLLGWAALARLREQGVTLGAHSRSHADLTRVAEPAAVEDEVLGSADVIERETGARPTVFAYPYGRSNSEVARVVANNFQYGCTTHFSALPSVVSRAQLPRLDMYYFRRASRLEQWGTPSLTRFIRMRGGLRRVRQIVNAGVMAGRNGS